jgi:phosphoglucosamine mutase
MTFDGKSEPLFGTDGIRGIPGEYPLLPDLVRRVALAAGRQLGRRSKLVLLGRDTRRSGTMLGRCLAEGFSAAGLRTVSVGVIPTPALSYLTPLWKADFAVMISASHNPAEFNGIKFFRPDGLKLDPERELEIEKRSADTFVAAKAAPALEDRSAEARRLYLEFLRSTFPAHLDLAGMKIVVDTANGAASGLAASLLESLGANVIAIGDKPTGVNINLGCGALDTAAMRAAVVRSGAAAGFSVDGDADRAMFSDEKGALLDGDHLLGLLAESLQSQGMLRGKKVVATVMSNVGLGQHLKDIGLGLDRVAVGDRNVTAALLDGDLSLGGESSGHIVITRFAKTGDGLLTALQVLAAFRRSGEPLSRFRRRFIMYPQIVHNLPVKRKVPLEELPDFQREVRRFQGRLGDKGRIFVRYSGTEPILRILAEGPKAAELKSMVQSLIKTYQSKDGTAGA